LEVVSPRSTQSLILLGRVTSLFGIKGWVNVFSYTEPPENILDYEEWLICACEGDGQSRRHNMPEEKDCKRVSLTEGQRHGKKIIARLNESDTRESAANFIKHDIFIYRDELPELNDEVYWIDLEGLEVINLQGQVLGKIKRMMSTGANDVMVLEGNEPEGKKPEGGEKGQDILIPYVEDHYVKKVDLEAGQVLVDWEFE